MLLSDVQIKDKKLIANSNEKNYRLTSYDVEIGTIISVESSEVDQMKLLPQGIVEVISKEHIHLPKDVTGFAMVKTSLCNEGILPLNIGIIDPGYEGPVSATLLNFSKKEFRLSKGKVFLRLTFHECHNSKMEIPINKSFEKYIEERKDKVANFSNTFLNLENTIKQATDPFLDALRNRALIWVPVFAFILALFTFLVTLGVNWGNRNYWTKEDLKSDLIKEVKANYESKNEDKIKELEEKISKLETIIKEQNRPK